MPYVKHCYYGPYKIYSHLWPYWLTTGDLRSKIDIMRKVRSMSAEVQPNMYVCLRLLGPFLMPFRYRCMIAICYNEKKKKLLTFCYLFIWFSFKWHLSVFFFPTPARHNDGWRKNIEHVQMRKNCLCWIVKQACFQYLHKH